MRARLKLAGARRAGTSAAAAEALPLALAAPPQPSAAAAELWAGLYLPALASPQVLAQLALTLQRFTPRVSLEPPDGVLLEVKGSLHLFAGLAGMKCELTHACRQHGLALVLAFAPTPRGALTAARAGRPLEIIDRGAAHRAARTAAARGAALA